VSMVELNTIFLWEETRTVDKADCVSLMGNTYEVETGFARTKVQLRYDPFDLLHVQVWVNGKQLKDASVLETVRKLDRRVSEDIELIEEPDGQLSFLEVAQARREQMWQESGLHYAKEGETK
jgi:putative transposase